MNEKKEKTAISEPWVKRVGDPSWWLFSHSFGNTRSFFFFSLLKSEVQSSFDCPHLPGQPRKKKHRRDATQGVKTQRKIVKESERE